MSGVLAAASTVSWGSAIGSFMRCCCGCRCWRRYNLLVERRRRSRPCVTRAHRAVPSALVMSYFICGATVSFSLTLSLLPSPSRLDMLGRYFIFIWKNQFMGSLAINDFSFSCLLLFFMAAYLCNIFYHCHRLSCAHLLRLITPPTLQPLQRLLTAHRRRHRRLAVLLTAPPSGYQFDQPHAHYSLCALGLAWPGPFHLLPPCSHMYLCVCVTVSACVKYVMAQ